MRQLCFASKTLPCGGKTSGLADRPDIRGLPVLSDQRSNLDGNDWSLSENCKKMTRRLSLRLWSRDDLPLTMKYAYWLRSHTFSLVLAAASYCLPGDCAGRRHASSHDLARTCFYKAPEQCIGTENLCLMT